MRLSVRRLRVDNDELEPDVTAGDLEVRTEVGKLPGLLSWSLTLVTADEPWHHGLGECQLEIDVGRHRQLRGRAVLIRSHRGRWHYFQGAGNLDGLDSSEFDSATG
jgi:hypothetical protein